MATFTAAADGDWDSALTWSSPQPIVNVVDNTIEIAGDFSGLWNAGQQITIVDSTGNNGTYTIGTILYADPNTEITITGTLPSATADGMVYLNEIPDDGDDVHIDFYGVVGNYSCAPATITCGYAAFGGSLTMTAGVLTTASGSFKIYNGFTIANFTDTTIANAAVTFEGNGDGTPISCIGCVLTGNSESTFNGPTTYLDLDADSVLSTLVVGGGTKTLTGEGTISVLQDTAGAIAGGINIDGLTINTCVLTQTANLSTLSTTFSDTLELTGVSWNSAGSPELGTQDTINAATILNACTLGTGGYWYFNANVSTTGSTSVIGSEASNFYIRGTFTVNVSGDDLRGTWYIYGGLQWEITPTAVDIRLMETDATVTWSGKTTIYQGPTAGDGCNYVLGLGL